MSFWQAVPFFSVNSAANSKLGSRTVCALCYTWTLLTLLLQRQSLSWGKGTVNLGIGHQTLLMSSSVLQHSHLSRITRFTQQKLLSLPCKGLRIWGRVLHVCLHISGFFTAKCFCRYRSFTKFKVWISFSLLTPWLRNQQSPFHESKAWT